MKCQFTGGDRAPSKYKNISEWFVVLLCVLPSLSLQPQLSDSSKSRRARLFGILGMAAPSPKSGLCCVERAVFPLHSGSRLWSCLLSQITDPLGAPAAVKPTRPSLKDRGRSVVCPACLSGPCRRICRPPSSAFQPNSPDSSSHFPHSLPSSMCFYLQKKQSKRHKQSRSNAISYSLPMQSLGRFRRAKWLHMFN